MPESGLAIAGYDGDSTEFKPYFGEGRRAAELEYPLHRSNTVPGPKDHPNMKQIIKF